MTAGGKANVGRESAITGELRLVFKSINKTTLPLSLVVKTVTNYTREVHRIAEFHTAKLTNPLVNEKPTFQCLLVTANVHAMHPAH
uniref:Uncharacterized protein n=1 Tax=Arundo donax TaxID=35708 RepID=A0A0A9EI37_ARUDO